MGLREESRLATTFNRQRELIGNSSTVPKYKMGGSLGDGGWGEMGGPDTGGGWLADWLAVGQK